MARQWGTERRVGLWSRYIAWVDRDLDAHLPSVNCVSAMVPFVPFLPLLPWLAWGPPSEPARYLAGGVAGSASVALLGIWIWRILAALVWQPPK